MEVILVEPEIPQNAGSIARTCAVTGSRLTLIRPLGFTLCEKTLKRAALDYWQEVDVQIFNTLEEALGTEFYFFSSKASRSYTEASFSKNAQLIFGSETKGLSPEFALRYPERFLTIPMRHDMRCLNLANAASIVLYEAWRQQNFSW